MARRKAPEELSVEELRRLLIEKRRGARRERLEHFKRTGRVVDVEPESIVPVVDTLEGSGDQPQVQVSTRRRVMDRILLVVEVLAVVGLGGVLISGFGVLRDLNEEVASALIQETFTPTPLVMAVVLPSGHTPPDAQGNTRPNDAEIPEHLRPMVQSLASIAIPTPAPDQAIRIQIPALNVDAPIVQGDGWEQLKKGVGQNIGSANPGQNGNVVLSAHNDVYGEIFRYLDRLDDIYGLFAKASVQQGSLEQYAQERARRGTSEVDAELLNEIDGWREELARNIALRNPGLSVHELNDAVQRTIDRIIFLRMAEDRSIEE